MNTYTDSRIINLNSDKGSTYYNGSFLSHITFSFSSILKDEKDIVNVQCGVLNAQIPVSFYIINEYNNTLYFNYDSTDYTLSIPYGNYNSSTLITYLKENLLALTSSIWTIEINKSTGLLSFATNNTFIFYGSSTCVSVLGLEKNVDSYSSSSSPYKLLCPYPLNLLGIKKLKIASSVLAVNNVDSWAGGFCNIISVIPVNQPAFGLIQYMNQGNPYGLLRSKIVDNIDILIFDEFNNLIDFNNVNWTISLEMNITRQLNIVDNTMSITNTIDENLINNDEEPIGNEEDKPVETTQGTRPNFTNAQDTLNNIDNISIDPAINNDLDLLMYNNVI